MIFRVQSPKVRPVTVDSCLTKVYRSSSTRTQKTGEAVRHPRDCCLTWRNSNCTTGVSRIHDSVRRFPEFGAVTGRPDPVSLFHVSTTIPSDTGFFPRIPKSCVPPFLCAEGGRSEGSVWVFWGPPRIGRNGSSTRHHFRLPSGSRSYCLVEENPSVYHGCSRYGSHSVHHRGVSRTAHPLFVFGRASISVTVFPGLPFFPVGYPVRSSRVRLEWSGSWKVDPRRRILQHPDKCLSWTDSLLWVLLETPKWFL